VYPAILAVLMKALPFRYEPSAPNKRVPADFLISLFNQCLFFIMVFLIFLMARRLFDSSVAWLSAFALFASELFWRFTISGLPTLLLVLLFVVLCWLLLFIEQESSEKKRGDKFLLVLAVLSGLVVGIGALTKYSFAAVIIPVSAFLLLFCSRRPVQSVLLALLAFLLVISPWLARNYRVCGQPLGLSSYAFLKDTFLFPGDTLERSLQPDLGSRGRVQALWEKMMTNSRQLLREDLPKLGGTWVSAFFLAGLLIAFKNVATRRLRYFVLMSLAVLAVTQVVCRAQPPPASPEITSDNLLILIAPLGIVYGVGFFFLLLDQIQFEAFQLRYAVVGLFATLLALPMLFALRPRPNPLAYPTYHPAGIAYFTSALPSDGLVMSDVPWAVAWYGRRQSVLYTLQALTEETQAEIREDFSIVNNYYKAVRALYLTPVTTQSAFLNEERGWGKFIMLYFLARQVPPAFPLSFAPPRSGGWDQIILGDSDYWR
jgi:4-amino-4-deoxy-L-arabinose transferase-like glycosyltransferase